MLKSSRSMFAVTALMLACSSNSNPRPSDGELDPEEQANDLSSTIRSAPECADRGSDACKDLVGETLFRGVFFQEGPAASALGERAPAVPSKVDTAGLTQRLSSLSQSRASYCARSDSHCVRPGESAALDAKFAALTEAVKAGAVSQDTLEAGVMSWLDAPNADRFVDGMRTVAPRVFIDFAKRLTSGSPIETAEGMRAATDALLTALVDTVEPGTTVLKGIQPQFPPLDPVVDIETAIYVVVVVAVAVAITIAVPLVDQPFDSSLQNSMFVGQVSDSFAGLLTTAN